MFRMSSIPSDTEFPISEYNEISDEFLEVLTIFYILLELV